MTRVGSLCSGYGGLEMGLLAHLGPSASVAWHVEYDKYPSMILAHHHPHVPNYGDVKTTDWTRVEPVDWLTAGYPCQPFSHAGHRKGSDDPRHLWPAVAAAVGALRPRHVLLENVAGHVSLGLDTVLWDLASLGYDATWGVVRASDAGAPHGRARLFIVATDTAPDAGGERHGRREDTRAVGRVDREDASGPRERERSRAEPRDRGSTADAPPDSNPARLQRLSSAAGDTGPDAFRSGARAFDWRAFRPAIERWERTLGRRAPHPVDPGQPVGAGPAVRFVEWMMGLPDGWVTGVPGLPRNAQFKALGNGVVPQQALLALRLLHPHARGAVA